MSVVRIDPIEQFSGAFGSVWIRILLAWLAIWAGFAIPAAMGGGFDTVSLLAAISYHPLMVIGLAAASGWWSLVALPLAFVLAYRGVRFITDEAGVSGLAVLGLLSILVCARAANDGFVLCLIASVPLYHLLLANHEPSPLR